MKPTDSRHWARRASFLQGCSDFQRLRSCCPSCRAREHEIRASSVQHLRLETRLG